MRRWVALLASFNGRACRIMWRLQHGISPKTTKDPFVLCHHAELDQSKVMFHVAPMKSQYALMACSTVSTTPCCICPTVKDRRAPPSSCILHSTSLILHPSHGFLILPPAMNQCPIHAWSLHSIPLSSSYVCSPQRLALILIPYVCSLHGAECVAVV